MPSRARLQAGRWTEASWQDLPRGTGTAFRVFRSVKQAMDLKDVARHLRCCSEAFPSLEKIGLRFGEAGLHGLFRGWIAFGEVERPWKHCSALIERAPRLPQDTIRTRPRPPHTACAPHKHRQALSATRDRRDPPVWTSLWRAQARFALKRPIVRIEGNFPRQVSLMPLKQLSVAIDEYQRGQDSHVVFLVQDRFWSVSNKELLCWKISNTNFSLGAFSDIGLNCICQKGGSGVRS